MRILIDIGHPAQVHYFKNFIWLMRERGHEFLITARNRGITFDLLKAYGFDYVDRGRGSPRLLGKLLYLPKADFLLYDMARKFRADLFLSFGSMYAAQASKMLSKPHIAFDDTEHSKLEHLAYLPFTDAVCTPSYFMKDFGRKQVRFDGFIELCYLHPNYFKPNPAVLDELGIRKDDKFFVIRFVSWEATHDISQAGLSVEDKKSLIRELSEHGQVLISSESRLPKEFENYKIKASPEKIHDILHYATMYVGEGATMATESGLLDTPSILLSSLVGTMGNFVELEKYGLVYSLKNPTQMMQKIRELLGRENLKQSWMEKREKLLRDKIDVTAFMMWLVEKYPESFNVMHESPDYQYKFR